MASHIVPGTFKEMERTGWHERAPSYDARVGRRTRTVAARLVDAVGAGPGQRFLDVCCGPGYSAGEATARGADALGIDIAPGMVEAARRLFPQASYRVGDAEALDLPDASLDAVVCAFGMLHVPQPERAIDEVFRVLRPGGRYAWTVWTSGDTAPLSAIAQQAIKEFGNLDVPLPPAPPRDLFSSERNAHAALEAAGFVDVTSEELEITFRAASLDEVWDWYERGTVRTAALLHLQTPEALERIKAAILAGAARFVGADGISAPHNAIMHFARKPANAAVLLQSLSLGGERLVRTSYGDRSGGEHCVPDLRSAFSGNAQPTQGELPFANPMDQLDSPRWWSPRSRTA